MRLPIHSTLLLALLGVAAASPYEQREATTPQRLNVIVTMKSERPSELTDAKAIRRKMRKLHVSCDADRELHDHVEVMVGGLIEHAKESHAPVLELIQNEASNATDAKSLWITNEVSVRDATPELVEKIRAMPEVADVRVEKVARLPIHVTHSANVSATATSTTEQQNTWSLERIQVPQVWEQGFNGTGIRVAAADSGALDTHTSIAGRMVPIYGWFDAVDSSASPIDPLGHGTSVLSILAGGNGLGVAPQATWMACRACDAGGNCDESWMLTCAQFLLCPFDAEQQMDCSQRPHVINMSWNYDFMDERLLEPAIAAWLAAGIVPVFSNGNRGSKCRTVTSPADWTSGITVGATTAADDIASLSARGPNLNGEIKPDLAAPGIGVVAAHSSSPSAVVAFTGTSASAPFVSGAVALMLQANAALKPSKVKSLLTGSTDQASLVPHITDSCLPTAAKDTAMVFPNNVYGHGRLNVLKAVTQALQTPLQASSRR